MTIIFLQRFQFSALIVFFSLISISAIGQTPTTKATIFQGEEASTSKSKVIEVVGHDETGYYILRQKEEGALFIEHINNEIVIDVSRKIAKITDNGLIGLPFSFASLFSSNLYFFYTTSDFKGKKQILVFQKVDKKTLIPDANLIAIDSTTWPAQMSMAESFAYSDRPLFMQDISPNDSYVAFFNNELFSKENGEFPKACGFQIRVVDSTMKMLWEKHIRVPYPVGKFFVKRIVVDDLGNAYVVAIEKQEKDEAKASRKAGRPDYRYHLYRYAANGNDDFEMPVEFGDKFISAIELKSNNNGDMIASGFYSEKGSNDAFNGTFSIKGAFYICIDGKTNDIKTQKFTAFEKDFITDELSDFQKQKAEKDEDGPEMDNYYMDELLINADGGAILVAEQYTDYSNFSTVSNGYGGTYSDSHTYYHYKNILVLAFNPDGSVKWKCKIQKNQKSADDEGRYSSYVFAKIDDKLYFIYNDNPENLNLQPGEAIHKHTVTTKAAVILAEIDNDGKVSKELLMNAERFELRICPSVSEQTGEKEVLLLSEKQRTHAFIKVTFN